MSNQLMFMITLFGGLAFTMVTLVLYTLAHQLESAITRHDLIREARLRQQAYHRSVMERRRGANADYDDGEYNVDIEGEGDFNVDIVDDQEPSAPRMAA